MPMKKVQILYMRGMPRDEETYGRNIKRIIKVSVELYFNCFDFLSDIDDWKEEIEVNFQTFTGERNA